MAATGSTAGSVIAVGGDVHEDTWPARRWWVLGLILVVLAIMIVPTVRRYVDQRQQIAAQRAHIAQQERTVDDLARERARWDDPAFIEAQARERLHFVKAGETGYTLTTRQNPQVAQHDTHVVGVDAGASALPWYGKVWGSLQAADRLGATTRRTPAPAPGGRATSVPPISDTAPPAEPSGTGPSARHRPRH